MVLPLKDKNSVTFTKAFEKVLNNYGRKPKKIWIDKASEFYNRLM